MIKEKLEQLINLVREFEGYLTLSYVPKSTIYSAEKLDSLYYSGWKKIEISDSTYHLGNKFIDITDSNINEVIDEIYKLLKDDVGKNIMKALENLELADEYLKYFDREEHKELFKKFQKEVLRLKKLDNKIK